MPKKRCNAEEIIHKLREADVLLSQGKTVSHACKQLGVSGWGLLMAHDFDSSGGGAAI